MKSIKYDFVFNYISFIILGISGISINLIIGRFYGAEILGAFNQTLSTYIVFSMLGSGGINYSLLQTVSENSDNNHKLKEIVKGSILPTIFISSPSVLISPKNISTLKLLIFFFDSFA